MSDKQNKNNLLSDKIWLTRKARINTEQRLRRNALITEIIVIYCSVLLLVLSLVNLSFESTSLMNIALTVGSVILLVTSIFISSQKYIERSLTVRNCYIHLDELFSKVKRAEDKNDISQIENYEKEYFKALSNVENHSSYDFLCLKYSLRNNANTTLPPFTCADRIKYFTKQLKWKLVVAFVFIVPLLVVSFLLWRYLQLHVSS